mgnify:CR=1 FL=1
MLTERQREIVKATVPLLETGGEALAKEKGIVAGDYDHLPEAAFYMVGAIEEVVEKAAKMDSSKELNKNLLLANLANNNTAEAKKYAAAADAQAKAAMAAAGDTRTITTEITPAGPFYFAEDEHQQYLYKNPRGYCGLGGIGVCLPPQQ